jgi:hypothetical protein
MNTDFEQEETEWKQWQKNAGRKMGNSGEIKLSPAFAFVFPRPLWES